MNRTDTFFAGTILGTILATIALACTGALCRDKPVKIEAVKHGAATWVVAEDGTTTFKWHEIPSPETFQKMRELLKACVEHLDDDVAKAEEER